MLEFDLSSLTYPVSSAVLSFNIIGGAGPDTSVNILGYKADGDITLSDSYMGNSMLGMIDIEMDMSTSRINYSLDVTDYINQMLLSDSSFVGFNMRIASEYTNNVYGYNNEVIISTLTNSNIFNPPGMTISAVPLPASLWLFLTGVVPAIAFTRKSKRLASGLGKW
jgi:hypothetical protein